MSRPWPGEKTSLWGHKPAPAPAPIRSKRARAQRFRTSLYLISTYACPVKAVLEPQPALHLGLQLLQRENGGTNQGRKEAPPLLRFGYIILGLVIPWVSFLSNEPISFLTLAGLVLCLSRFLGFHALTLSNCFSRLDSALYGPKFGSYCTSLSRGISSLLVPLPLVIWKKGPVVPRGDEKANSCCPLGHSCPGEQGDVNTLSGAMELFPGVSGSYSFLVNPA